MSSDTLTYDSIQLRVDSYFKRFGWYLNSNITNEKSCYLLKYEVPPYCLAIKRPQAGYSLEFKFPYTEDGVKMAILTGGPSILKKVLTTFADVDSFLDEYLKLATATPLAPVAEQLFMLNKKMDKLIEIISKQSN